jgi:hypothetical protein
MKTIPLTQGREAIVDDEDYGYLSQWKWHFDGHYAARNRSRKKGCKGPMLIRMHRMIQETSEAVDHINHNKLDNRRSNLRPVTHQQNCLNMPLSPTNTSGYTGVSAGEGGKWLARLKTNGKLKHLGTFDTPEEASKAYKAAKDKLRCSVGHHLDDYLHVIKDKVPCVPTNTSCGLTGVTRSPRSKRWIARIQVNNTKRCLGYFDTPEEASAAYKTAKASQK